jgi:glyoxylate carboligase
LKVPSAQRASGGDFFYADIECFDEIHARKRSMLRKNQFDNVPIKPQCVYKEMTKAFGQPKPGLCFRRRRARRGPAMHCFTCV